MEFECNHCGKCCKEMAICITYSDIMRWKQQNRNDILREVSFSSDYPLGSGFYVATSIVGPEKKPCPFFIDDLCSIHKTKPVSCKDFPLGFSDFNICPVWKSEYLNKKRLKKIKNRQAKDFKRCKQYVKELYKIIVESRNAN